RARHDDAGERHPHRPGIAHAHRHDVGAPVALEPDRDRSVHRVGCPGHSMNRALTDVDWLALWALWIGLALAASMAGIVIAGRLGQSAHEQFRRRLTRRYGPLIDRALRGDAEALDGLVRSPSRYRLDIARLLIFPLVHDRSPNRIAATRDIIRAMSLVP